MRTRLPCCSTPIFAASLLSVVSPSSAMTLSTFPLNLSKEELQILGDSACNTPPEEMRTHQIPAFKDRPGQAHEPSDVPERWEYGTVYCGPHAEDAGRPIGLMVWCQRPPQQELWDCGKAMPLVQMKIAERKVRVLYQSTTAKDAVEVIEYLLSRPRFRGVVVDPAWLVSDVSVHRGLPTDFVSAIDARVSFSVVASGYHMQIIREKGEDGTRFGIEGMTIWHGDVGVPVGE
jgi:hypothetical protein